MPAPPAHPETVKHMVDFLKHDSDNRHSFSEKEGERRFRLKRGGLIVAALLAAILISIPLIALFKGEREFVSNFLDRQLPYLIGLVAAFVGGMGARNIFK